MTMTAPRHNCPSHLSFDWCTTTWEDPLTGTQVVRLSPEMPLHFRTAYYRTPVFTPDGRTMLMAGHDPDGVSPEWGGAGSCTPNGRTANLFALDLTDGTLRDFGAFTPGANLWYAASPCDRLAHLIVSCGDHEEILRIDLDTGSQWRIVPSVPQCAIWSAECSADARYLYTTTPNPKATYSAYTSHVISRIDLETGQTVPVIDDPWPMKGPSPNPVRPEILMCGWSDDAGITDPDYQHARVRDLSSDCWLDMPWWLPDGNCAHEMWSRDGEAIYFHGGFHGYQTIGRFRLATRRWELFVVPIGAGDSAHVHVAPDQSFMVGDGKNWGWNTEHEAPVQMGDGFDFDGVGCHSPGEVIWKFELPQESILIPDHPYHRRDDLLAPVLRHPDKVVRTTPVCRFRSLSRLRNMRMRLESNAQVTPDSRWVTFQSCSEQGLFEIWAARITEIQMRDNA